MVSRSLTLVCAALAMLLSVGLSAEDAPPAPAAVDGWLKQLSDTKADANDREEAFAQLRALKTQPAALVDTLLALLDDPVYFFRIRALNALSIADSRNAAAVPIIIKHLADRSWDTRKMAYEYWKQFQPEDVATKYSNETKHDVRYAAAHALAMIGIKLDEEAVALAELFPLERPETRATICDLLSRSKLGGKKIIPLLIKGLQDAEENVQLYTVGALHQRAADAAETAPALMDLLLKDSVPGRLKLRIVALVGELCRNDKAFGARVRAELVPKLSDATLSASITRVLARAERGEAMGPNDFLGGRNAAMRAELVKTYGGSPATEKAVDKALMWMAYHQEADGHWDAMKYGAANKVDTAVTGFAVLALLAAGHTETNGNFRENVKRAVDWLISKQQTDGLVFDQTDAGGHRGIGYPAAIATLALCEAAAMSKSPQTLAAAQKAVEYVSEHQQGQGDSRLGWRYSVKTPGDLSVSSWFIQALKSAEAGELKVDPDCLAGASKFLDGVEMKNGTSVKYAYQPGKDPNKRRGAMGALDRLYLGAKTEEVLPAVETFFKDGGVPGWGANGDTVDLYYWYYGTQCCFHAGGALWKDWNEAMKSALVDNQCKMGDDAGSWPVVGDFCGEWGRAGQTSLAALCLEVYYRYGKLP